MTFHRTPSALALNDILCDFPRAFWTYDSDVGTIARTYKTTLTDAKQTGRIMTHQLDQTLDGKHAGIYQFEHRYQRELHHRHT